MCLPAGAASVPVMTTHATSASVHPISSILIPDDLSELKCCPYDGVQLMTRRACPVRGAALSSVFIGTCSNIKTTHVDVGSISIRCWKCRMDIVPTATRVVLRRLSNYTSHTPLTKSSLQIPINMPLCASTGPVLDRCWQHRTSTCPVMAHYGMFMGM